MTNDELEAVVTQYFDIKKETHRMYFAEASIAFKVWRERFEENDTALSIFCRQTLLMDGRDTHEFVTMARARHTLPDEKVWIKLGKAVPRFLELKPAARMAMLKECETYAKKHRGVVPSQVFANFLDRFASPAAASKITLGAPLRVNVRAHDRQTPDWESTESLLRRQVIALVRANPALERNLFPEVRKLLAQELACTPS